MPLPTPTAISPTTRYMVAGTRKWVFVSTIANKNAPSLAEINAGTDLSGEVMSSAGFQITGNALPAPDAGSRWISETAGRITATGSALTLYCSGTSSDARSLLPRDTTGFIVIFPEGIITGGKCSVWPVRVMSDPFSTDIEANATIDFQFVITSLPAENIAIPLA